MKRFSSAGQSKAIANFIQNLSDVEVGSEEDLDGTDEAYYLFFFCVLSNSKLFYSKFWK